jgi:hypothetical protein
MSPSISQLGFLCVFHLIGGAALGYALRGVLRGNFSCNSFFFFLWGGLFGGIPLAFGIQEFQKGAPYFLAIQCVVFAIAILTPKRGLAKWEPKTFHVFYSCVLKRIVTIPNPTYSQNSTAECGKFRLKK